MDPFGLQRIDLVLSLCQIGGSIPVEPLNKPENKVPQSNKAPDNGVVDYE